MRPPDGRHASVRQRGPHRARYALGPRADVTLVPAGHLATAATVAGGVLGGPVASSLARAPMSGLYLGELVRLVFAVSLLFAGTRGPVAGMGKFALLSVGVGHALPTPGAVDPRTGATSVGESPAFAHARTRLGDEVRFSDRVRRLSTPRITERGA